MITHVYTTNIEKANVGCEVCDCYYSDHNTVT